MKEREIIETKKVDNEIISNIEQQFDHITNPEQWLENYSYEQEPIKILNKVKLKNVRNINYFIVILTA